MDRIQRLELDIDIRMIDLWAEIHPDLVSPVLERVARAAYAMGYRDACRESGAVDKLGREHGYN